MKKASICSVLVVVASFYAAGQESSSAGVPAHMVVTVLARHGNSLPDVTQQDVMVYEGRKRHQVTDWIPARGENAALEFFILIDDGTSFDLGSQFEDLRQFINAQPATTKVGIAYMRDGVTRVAQNLTTDHAQAAKAVRLPLGAVGANSSPYFSLQDLIKHWPESTARREVFMVSDGVDWAGGAVADDRYVDAAVADAQRAGVIVYNIYMPGRGRAARSYRRYRWGQVYLSQVADQTGGESYYIGFNGDPVSLGHYLESISHRLNNQYFLGFLAQPERKAGLRQVRLQTELPNAKLVGAKQVFVPASQ